MYDYYILYILTFIIFFLYKRYNDCKIKFNNLFFLQSLIVILLLNCCFKFYFYILFTVKKTYIFAFFLNKK